MACEAGRPLSMIQMKNPAVLNTASEVCSFAKTLFGGFEEACAAAPVKACFSIAGCNVHVHTDLPEQADIYRRALADQNLGGRADSRILVAGRNALPGIPSAPIWKQYDYNDRRLTRKLEPTSLRVHYYQERNFWQFYDKENCIGVQLMADPSSLPDWDSGSPLRNFLRWTLSGVHSGFLHSGALAEDGRGIMLVGPGGSGKSGTVLAGLNAGLQSVGDDYILGRTDAQNPGCVTVEPLFNTLKNDTSGLERLGIIPVGPKNWQGKHQFTFQDLVSRPPDASLLMGALCVPEITGGHTTTFELMPHQEAFLALAQTGFSQMPGDLAQNFKFCSEVVKRLPTFRLKLGVEPTEIAESIRQFIRKGPLAC